jgi:hypothetical protein
MKPICLYANMLKVQIIIVANKNNLVWHTNRVLHPAQYGYQLDKEVHMALLSTINEIEDAHKKKETTFITVWDIRRAFDSIPRLVPKATWKRLRIPRHITDWFA